MLPNFDTWKNDFTTLIQGKAVQLYLLTNDKGMVVAITNFGATIVHISVPDHHLQPVSVVAGFDKISHYQSEVQSFYGCTVGRYANRIANGKFTLDGIVYHLPINNAPNNLHGGPNGFHTKVWDIVSATSSSIILNYISPNGEEGFPGELNTTVTFSLNDLNELKMDYNATSNKNTIINLTNHAYFNLNGVGRGDILQHQLMINADSFVPVTETLIPTGTTQSVKDTPFDFLTVAEIGARINANDQQLKYGSGYDHSFVLNKYDGKMGLAAIAKGNISGISLSIFTTEPGMQLYTGNFMSGANQFAGGITPKARTAFCLETQHFPDSPNQPTFPSVVLKAGNTYHTTTIYKFS
jgi:aldose 1-epimerase